MSSSSARLPDWVAEQAPEQLLAALTAFLAPYRDGLAAANNPRPHAAGD
jgi:hypothetical protein